MGVPGAVDAVLLAGGFGTRLRPLTYTRPKPLLPVAGRPMVEWVLDRLPPEVDRVIVTVNWQAEKLRAHFEDSDRDLEFVVVNEDEPLGTAGAVLNCQEHLGDRFFVLNADIVSSMNLAEMLQYHLDTAGVATISLKEVEPEEVVHYGVATMDPEEEGRIQGFVEKPPSPDAAPSRLINAGAYILEASVLDHIPAGRLVSMEKEIFPILLTEGMYGMPFQGDWVDVGDAERLRTASRRLDPDHPFGADSSVADSATIIDSVGGRQVTIGAGASVIRSVLGDGVTIAPGARIEDCIVGDDELVATNLVGQRVWSHPAPEGYPAKQVGNAVRN